jgi:CheY-like chemotaxis protein
VTNSEAEGFEGRMDPPGVRRRPAFQGTDVHCAAVGYLCSSAGCSAFHPSEGANPGDRRPPVPPTHNPSRALAGLRVLVVEDDTDARELVTAILEDAGAIVEAAESAAAGFVAVRSFQPQLLLSDISMPDEDGYSLIRRVRALGEAEGGGIPSIALTAHTRIEDRTKALRAGFNLHMGKPVRPDDLVAAVKTLATSNSN